MLAIRPSNSVKIASSLLIQNNGTCVHLLHQPAFICTPAAAKVFSGYAVFLETVIKPAVKICRKTFDIVNIIGEPAIGSHANRKVHSSCQGGKSQELKIKLNRSHMELFKI